MFFQLTSNNIQLEGQSLLPYTTETRELIWAAKIKRDPLALHTIGELALAQFRLESLSVIIPMPSSLLSKVFGRNDIALHVADRLATQTNWPLELPPFKLQFSVRKQTSGRHKFDHAIKISRRSVPFSSTAQILLVDDVITTGQSLFVLTENLGLQCASFFTIAYAGDFMSNLRGDRGCSIFGQDLSFQ